MRRLFFAILSFALVSSASAADTSSCYSISNADARNYCIAKAKNDRSVCYNIQKADLRAQCMAEVG